MPSITDRDRRYFAAGRSLSVPGLFSRLAGDQRLVGSSTSRDGHRGVGATCGSVTVAPIAGSGRPCTANWSTSATSAGSGARRPRRARRRPARRALVVDSGRRRRRARLAGRRSAVNGARASVLRRLVGGLAGRVGGAVEPTGRPVVAPAPRAARPWAPRRSGVSGFCGVGAPVPHGSKSLQATSRNRSCAWRFTISPGRARLSPGISTRRSGCRPGWSPRPRTTPEPLTRWSMMRARLLEAVRADGSPLAVR